MNRRRTFLMAHACRCGHRWPASSRRGAAWESCPRCRRFVYRWGLRLAQPAVDTGHALPSPRDLAERT